MSCNSDAPESSQQVAESIAVQTAMVAKVDLELGALHRQIEDRLAHKEELLDSLARSKSVIAPIRRLPVETLSMIFIQCIEDSVNTTHRDVALVCRWWKDVLWNTPDAWSFVSFVLTDRQRSMCRATTFVRRARKSSLRIKIDASGLRRSPSPATWEFLKEVLITIGRSSLSSVVISTGLYVPSSMVSRFITRFHRRRDVKQLVSFEINNTVPFTKDEAKICRTQLGSLPALTKLAIPSNLIVPAAPFLRHLTCLHVDSQSRNPVDLSPLQNCTSLSALSIKGYGEQRGPLLAPFTLPHLTSLRSISSSLRSIFFSVVTPFLENLIVEDSGYSGTLNVTNALKELIEQPNGPPPLTKIKLISSPCNQKSFIWVLERLPTILTLEIENSTKIDNLFITALTKEATPRRPWMLPNLKHVKFYNCRKVSRSLMEDLVRARVHDVPTEASAGKRKNKKLDPPCPLESVVWDEVDMLAFEAE